MKSLRLRLMVTLCVAIGVLWSSVAAWMFGSMQRELNHVLDSRLIASTRMVAGIVSQFSHEHIRQAQRAGGAADITPVISRDGVACEVSLVRGEVELLPLARTHNSPGFGLSQELGFGTATKGGKQWRTYVLEDNGVRITTADRMDVREHLVSTFTYGMILPFVLVLLGLLALTWWVCSLGLRPLQRLQQALQQRPPQDGTPITHGQDIRELAPMVNSLNALLARMDAAIEHERRWTADAAHELRTPLTAIKTHVQVTQLLVQRGAAHGAGAMDPAVTTSLQQAMQGIAHLQDTMEQLLLLARVETHSALVHESMQLHEVPSALERACVQVRARDPGHHRIATCCDLSVQAPLALSLPQPLLVCAVRNLLDNALRHHAGPQPVSLTVQVQMSVQPEPDMQVQNAQQLVVCVRDYGPGLSPQECALALQRFWRKNPAGQGSGLGLTIVQRIVQSAGGELVLEQPEDGGAGLQVVLRLPLQSQLLPPAAPVQSDAAQMLVN